MNGWVVSRCADGGELRGLRQFHALLMNQGMEEECGFWKDVGFIRTN